MNRREAIGAMTLGAGTLLAGAGPPAAGNGPEARPTGAPLAGSGGRPGGRALKPLPFDPKKLRGLSERPLVSHHENNYAGALSNLDRVEEEIARITKDTPPFVAAGLRERELAFANSVVLHELYFGNLGGDGKAGGAVERTLADAFGGFARWEEQFRAAGLSLSGGSGWAILAFDVPTGDLRISWAGGHTQALAWAHPLLVLDMYEHAYHMDYGAAAARYVDAFFENVAWEEVDRRLQRARKADAAPAG
jgi:Fe-Mn family superoxide dismutase